MPLHPHLQKQYELLQDIPSFEAAFASAEMTARFFPAQVDPEPWVPPQTVEVSDRTIEGPRGPIPLRIYRPRELSTPAGPGLLWMHGGRFVVGGLEMNEANMVALELCDRAGAVVVSVDYRLAVDGLKYPAPIDDVVASWAWFAENAEQLGADPARLWIGGASAGGNLATSAAMHVRDVGRRCGERRDHDMKARATQQASR